MFPYFIICKLKTLSLSFKIGLRSINYLELYVSSKVMHSCFLMVPLGKDYIFCINFSKACSAKEKEIYMGRYHL